MPARSAGQRLYELDAWLETLTRSPGMDGGVDARKRFSEKELVDLTYLITAINSWNRSAIALRAVLRTYKPAVAAATAS